MSGNQIDLVPGGNTVTSFEMTKGALGMEYLGGVETTVASTTVGPLFFPAKDVLFITGHALGAFSVVDGIAMQFNGDTAANYWSRNINSIQGSSTFNADDEVSATMMRMQYMISSGTSSLNPDDGGTATRVFFAFVQNRSTVSKTVGWRLARSTGTIGTNCMLTAGVGEWVNTTGNIQSVLLRTIGGTATMAAGSAFAVFGKDL